MKVKIFQPGSIDDLIMISEVALKHANRLKEMDANQHDIIAAGLVLKKTVDMWLTLIPMEEVEVPN